jgi:hypothetical protein
MPAAGTLNLISLFDFYLAAMLLLSTYRRFGVYHNFARIVLAFPGRWPKLIQLMGQHRSLFLTKAILRPLGFTAALMVVQMIASRVIWPMAHLTPANLLTEWWMIPAVVTTALAMLGVDVYFLIAVGNIDRAETEQYLDLAEHWLTTWKAPLVRAVTFGRIDPRRMVGEEVRKSMAEIGRLIGQTLWWMTLQLATRIAFGLSLWVAWALLPV